jgi:centriolar protein POC1
MKAHKIREYTGHKQPIYSLSPSYRAGHFLSCGSEGIVAEWAIDQEEGKAIVTAPSAVFSICVIPERKMVLLGLQTGDVVFADLEHGEVLRRVQLHKKSVFDLLPFPDGQHVLASSEDGAISVWNLDRLDHIHYQRISTKSVRTLTIDAENTRFFAGSSDNSIRCFDLGLNLKFEWLAHTLSVFRLLLGKDGSLYSTGRDAHINHWDVRSSSPACLQSVPAHNYAVNDLVHDENGRIYSGSMDKTIKVWTPDLELQKVVSFDKHQNHWNGVNRLLWLEGGLISCSDDRKIMRWAIENG